MTTNTNTNASTGNSTSASNPPLFFLATLKVRGGKMAEFCEVMPRVIAVMESHGWRLVGAWTHLIGRLNVVVDLWQIPDANALPSGFGVLMASREWPDISRVLGECVEDEVIQVMSRMPFDSGRIPDRWA